MLLIRTPFVSDIFPKKLDKQTPIKIPAYVNIPKPSSSTSNGYSKKTSPSTTDNNVSSSAPNSSTSAKMNTPSSTNSSGNAIGNSEPSHQSTAKKSSSSRSAFENSEPSHQSTVKKSSSSRVHFQKLAESISINDLKIPEILEVFTDLDRFIENELSEISVRKRVGQRMAKTDHENDIFTKLKDEYLKDKQQHQNDFEKHMKQQKRNDDKQFDTIQEEDESFNDDASQSLLDLTITSQMNRLREKKLEKLKQELVKQEYLLAKISRVLEHVSVVNNKNINDVIIIERHYLVASTRFQSALKEIRRLESADPLHPRPFHRKGKCVLNDIILEVKQSYFDRHQASRNEYVVVLLKNEDEVYASNAISITSDVRTLKFPGKFRVPEAFTDFSMRLEVYGTTFWRKHTSLRDSMLKKYGYVMITLADSGEKRSRFDMIEVIKGDFNPLRTKILMTIRQKITPDVHYQGILMVKLGEEWFKTNALLCGYLMEINLISDDDTESMLLDLHNFDNDFITPVVSRLSKREFTFLLKFNHYVGAGNEFQ